MNGPVLISKQAEELLEDLAESLQVPPSRYEAAERSYKSLGTGSIARPPACGLPILRSMFKDRFALARQSALLPRMRITTSILCVSFRCQNPISAKHN